jgi:tryptophan-rich sensory protein
MPKYAKLAVSILLTLSAGWLGSIFTTPAINGWYATLQKPSFNPPNWLFGPVWTFLFIAMGVSLYLIWQRGLEKPETKKAFVFFIVHLLFNVLWSVIFFGLKNLGLAFGEIIILWVMILALALNFYKIDKVAGILLIPYLCWVSFASFLNFAISRLNS